MSELPAIVRFVHLTATVLLGGVFSFALLIARPAYLSATREIKSDYLDFFQRQLRLARWYVAVIFASALLGLWLQHLAIHVASSSAPLGMSALLTLLSDTQYGRVWCARMILTLTLAALLWSMFRRESEKGPFAGVFIGSILSLCLLMSLALAGHAAAGEGVVLAIQVSVGALHLLASGLWLGGLMPFAALLRRCRRVNDAAALTVAKSAIQRFSCLALGSVAVLIATGGYNAWNFVGGFGALFGTAYGKLLLLKLALLLPLLAVGAMNLLQLKPSIVEAFYVRSQAIADHVTRLARNVTIEILLAFGILLVVGYMGLTPPARHVQPDWPFSFRWDWSLVDKAPGAAAEVNRGMIWGAMGIIAFIAALARRRRRMLTVVIGVGAVIYALSVIDASISTDAYPTTYKRPMVAYHAISVANGAHFYRESCVTCHGVSGYGDGPAAPTLSKKPVDLTAAHANNHTAGDLFWWLTYGIEGTPMPGFRATLSDEERWDVINFLRALSSGEKARELAPVIENEPWLVAPDFTYGLDTGEIKTLKEHRENNAVLLVLFNESESKDRLVNLADASEKLRAANLEILLVPHDLEKSADIGKPRLPIVTEGSKEISETYKLFARSFADDGPVAGTPHVEFLIDRQGYIRARWLPEESEGWKNLDRLISQAEVLRKEKPRAPAPDDHVH